MKSETLFTDFPLPRTLLRSLGEMKFLKPTPIQEQAIPVGLEGKDILATAQTGTGKTGAFAIPILAQLMERPDELALVVAPTRELAAQIQEVMGQMSRGLRIRGALLVGGESFGRQVDALERGPSYVIATPGRLNDHLQEGTLRLNNVRYFVLDEVDRMLDMGFAPQIKQVIRHLPEDRQTLMFSATLPKDIIALANSLLFEPVRIAIAPPPEEKSLVEEKVVRTSIQDKMERIAEVIESCPGKVLVFARTKSRTDRVARMLEKRNHAVVALHGGKTQSQRKRALEQFRSGKRPIMVATDIAGRGIDVTDIENVINFDIPMSKEDYVHRIGRTGRYGKTGVAITLVVPEDRDLEREIFGASSANAGPAPRRQTQSRGSRPRTQRGGQRGTQRGPQRGPQQGGNRTAPKRGARAAAHHKSKRR